MKYFIKRLLFYIYLLSTLACISTILGFFGSSYYLFEMLNSLRFQYIFFLSLIIPLTFLCKQRFLSIIFLLFLGINLFTVYNKERIIPSYENRSLSVIAVNLNANNNRLFNAINILVNLDPDILLISEITDRTINHLKPIEKAYPYKILFPRNDGFGIGLFSKIKLDNSSVRFSPDDNYMIPYIYAEIDGLHLYGIHPLHPTSSRYFKDRLGVFSAIKKHPKMIILGDFNTVPWSSLLKNTKKRLDLIDIKGGFRTLIPTWGTWIIFGLSIDGCLISKNISAKNYNTIPIPGSDHKAIIAEISY
ncbi:MAG: endonuclease/exonuclease/phosphatase family protein [Candidatus Aureabacteria bacterium]|nr:endonuclease/exonuclease/phosphatase family protein [Candidatus Auribacterota bacterium]